MLAGLSVAFGTSLLWPVALWIGVTWLLFAALKVLPRPRVRFPIALWLVTIPVAISALYSPNPGKALAWVSSVLIVWIIASNTRKLSGRFYLPVVVMVLIQYAMAWYEFENGLLRVSALERNASVLGLAGMSMFPLGAGIAGVSLSRTALLGCGVLTALNPTKTMIACLVIAVTISFTLGYNTNKFRYTLEGISHANELRLAAIFGNSPEIPPSTLPHIEKQERRLHWFGYGYGGYYLSTGQIQPHNVFVLSVWELGILSVPFWTGVMWLFWKHLNWHVAVVVLACGIFTDEFFGSVEGLYMLLSIGLLTKGITPCPERIIKGKLWRTLWTRRKSSMLIGPVNLK